MAFGKKINLNFKLSNLKNIDLKKINILDMLNKYTKRLTLDRKFLFQHFLWIVGIEILLILIFLLNLYSTYRSLAYSHADLREISLYTSIPSLKQNVDFSDLPADGDLPDLVNVYSKIYKEKKQYKEYFETLQTPYRKFLNYIYLPSLNVWKDKFTGKIDYSIIGQKFLDKNEYMDTNLLKKWGTYFKRLDESGRFEDNTIEDLRISNLQEEKDMYKITMDVKFSTSNKRNVLMLLNKLSLTSNSKNIALINEFMYQLWEIIREDKYSMSKIITTLNDYNSFIKSKEFKSAESDPNINKEKVDEFIKNISDFESTVGTGLISKMKSFALIQDSEIANLIDTIDKDIGAKLYKGIFENESSDILDGEILNKAIKKTSNCEEVDSLGVCYFKFREKYRVIPSMSYTIGQKYPSEKDQVNAFNLFFKNLPPLMDVTNFTFTEDKSTTLGNKYKGNIQIVIYGKGISDAELGDIALQLGDSCFKKSEAITIEKGLSEVDKRIKSLSDNGAINSNSMVNLIEIKKILQEMSTNYTGLTNYNKTIKIFELYRILKENSLCL